MHNGKRKLEKDIRNLPKSLVVRKCDRSKAPLPQRAYIAVSIAKL